MKFKVSTRKNKKYMVLTPKKRWIHFGDKRYGQYRDSTGLGVYSHLDHNDIRRRKNYWTRHTARKGNFHLDKESPSYYSLRYLW